MDPRTRILVVGDSHIRRLREFVEAPPDEFHGFVQLSMGLQVVILMVGGNDLTSATASALGVGSNIQELALSLAVDASCKKVMVGLSLQGYLTHQRPQPTQRGSNTVPLY